MWIVYAYLGLLIVGIVEVAGFIWAVTAPEKKGGGGERI